MKTIFLLMLIGATISTSFSQQSGTPGQVMQFGTEDVIYWGFKVENYTVKGLFAMYNHNSFWEYKQNDTIFGDSVTLVVEKIDTVQDKATLKQIPFKFKPKDITKVGLLEGETAVFDYNTLLFKKASRDSAEITIYKLGFNKTFVFKKDTVKISGTKMTYLHIQIASHAI